MKGKVIAMLVLSFPLYAQTIVKIVPPYVLINTDKGLGEKGAELTVWRKTLKGNVEIGTVQIVTFRDGQAAAKIKFENSPFKIQSGDFVESVLIETQNVDQIFEEMIKTEESRSNAPVHTRSFAELSAAQKQKFTREKLSIEVVGQSTIDYNWFWNTAEAQHWKKWTAYIGFDQPLTEAQFFKLTGYDHEAEQAKSYRSTANTMLWTGILTSLVGCAMMIYRTESQVDAGFFTYTEYEYPLFNAGILIAIVGGGFGGAGWIMHRKNWAPYATVKNISDEYNRELLGRL